MVEVVTFGETMVMMNPRDSGPLRYAAEFRKQLGGTESNVAVGLAKLGRDVAWFSRLGADPHGRYVEASVRGEGVDTDAVVLDPDAPTGVFFKERRSAGDERVFYYRHGSAASRLSPADLPRRLVADADYLHVTGITLALSRSCRETVFEAVELAREHGVTVSVDPNLRYKLWDDREEMVEATLDLLASSDVAFPGVGEADALFGTDDPAEIAEAVRSMGPSVVAVKLGEDGAYVAGPDVGERVPAFEVEPVDEIGAGDGFVAGFLAARLSGRDLVESTRRGNAVGALVTTVPGDVEGLPALEELETFVGPGEVVMR